MGVLRIGTVVIVLVALATACGGGRDAAGPGDGGDPPPATSTAGPDEPVTGGPVEPPPGDDPGRAERVTPRPGMVDVRPRPFERAEPGPDDRTVTVTFWSGVEPCYVLDRVDVDEGQDQVVITLYEGSDPAARDTACIELAVLKEVEVELSGPLGDRRIVDGAA